MELIGSRLANTMDIKMRLPSGWIPSSSTDGQNYLLGIARVISIITIICLHVTLFSYFFVMTSLPFDTHFLNLLDIKSNLTISTSKTTNSKSKTTLMFASSLSSCFYHKYQISLRGKFHVVLSCAIQNN